VAFVGSTLIVSALIAIASQQADFQPAIGVSASTTPSDASPVSSGANQAEWRYLTQLPGLPEARDVSVLFNQSGEYRTLRGALAMFNGCTTCWEEDRLISVVDDPGSLAIWVSASGADARDVRLRLGADLASDQESVLITVDIWGSNTAVASDAITWQVPQFQRVTGVLVAEMATHIDGVHSNISYPEVAAIAEPSGFAIGDIAAGEDNWVIVDFIVEGRED